jgi:hypothetical protein
VASPIETPMRTASGSGLRWLWRSMPCWIATAHDNARLGEVNISIKPSPVLLISIPPVPAAEERRTAK